MRKAIFLAVAAGVFTATTSGVRAETSKTALLNFAFRDSTRGTVVRPDAVLVDNEVVFNTIDEAGRMTIPVTPGDHRVVIKARGYADMDSRQTGVEDQSPKNTVMLDPLSPPEQLLPENLSQGMPADGTLICGFVVDAATGKPLAGADAELLGKDIKVKTDKDGFFKLPVSMPDGKQMPEDPRGVVYAQRDFTVSMAGFGFEERVNVLVESGAPKIFNIDMIRGGGGNSHDESAGRNNLQSSLFGLTNVEPEDPPTSASMPLKGHEGHSH